MLKLMPIESMIPSNYLILCHPPSLAAFKLSQHQGHFQWVSSLHQVAYSATFTWFFCVCVCVCFSVMPNSLWSHGHSLPDSSVHGILQTRIWEWVAMPFSRGSSQPRDWTQVSWIAGRFFTIWATRETVYIKTYIFLHSLRGRGRHNCSTPYFSNLLHKYLNLHS